MNAPAALLSGEACASVSAEPSVFLVPVLNKWLFYAPLSGMLALINHSAGRLLQQRQVSRFGGDIETLFDAVRSEPLVGPHPREGEIVPAMLGILPTRGCNMACTYCHFGGPTAAIEFMRPEIAVAAIDWAATRLEEARQEAFHVQFFGGEPFIARDIVETVVHRTRYVAAEKALIPWFDASTNGFFGKRMAQFIGDYFDGVVLSLDGPSDLQNKYRPAAGMRGSAATVERTARFLSETPVSLCLRMCVTQDSVERMEEIVRWMIESFNPSAINFETLTPGVLAKRAGLETPDPYLFARFAERSRQLVEKCGIKTVYAAAEATSPRLTFCPMGGDAVIVAPDGRLGACYLLPEEWIRRGLDLDFGHVDPDGHVSISPDALQIVRGLPVSKPRCRECFCRYSCAGGCHVNQTYPGSSTQYTDFCIQTRVLTACRQLRELGFADLATDLVEDREAMARLALHSADGLPNRSDRPAITERTDSTRKVPPTTRSPRIYGSDWKANALRGAAVLADAAVPTTGSNCLNMAYRIAPNVRWSVELRGLLVVDEAGATHCISYPQAAVWDLIDKGRALNKIIAAMQAIAANCEESPEQLVQESIVEWMALGLLEPKAGAGTNGQSVDY